MKSLLLLALLLPTAALADSSSLVTLGFSAGLGVRQSALADGGAAPTFEPELGARLRLFRVLGAELELMPRFATDELVTEGVGVRASGLLYLVPLDVIGIYLKGGIGHSALDALSKDFAAWETVHLGAGLEVYAGEHFAISAEVMNEIRIDELAARFASDSLLDLENFRGSIAMRFFL